MVIVSLLKANSGEYSRADEILLHASHASYSLLIIYNHIFISLVNKTIKKATHFLGGRQYKFLMLYFHNLTETARFYSASVWRTHFIFYRKVLKLLQSCCFFYIPYLLQFNKNLFTRPNICCIFKFDVLCAIRNSIQRHKGHLTS